MEVKVCKRCKEFFPNSLEFFRKEKKAKNSIGNICLICERKRVNEQYQKHKETHQQYYLKNKERLKEQFQKNYLLHREERIAKAAEWKRNNRIKVSENWKKNHPKNREKLLEKGRLYREQHRKLLREKSSQYYENNKEQCARASKKWSSEHRDKCSYITQTYRNKKKLLACTLTFEQWEQTKLYFNNKCAYCGKETSLNQEHFIALANGGEFTQENIIPSCLSCNCSKSTKDFFEWYPTYKYYSKEREEQILMFFSYISKMKGVCQNGKYSWLDSRYNL